MCDLDTPRFLHAQSQCTYPCKQIQRWQRLPVTHGQKFPHQLHLFEFVAAAVDAYLKSDRGVSKDEDYNIQEQAKQRKRRGILSSEKEIRLCKNQACTCPTLIFQISNLNVS